MEREVEGLHDQIGELQQALYRTRQAYEDVRQQKQVTDKQCKSLADQKRNLEMIMGQIVPRIREGARGIQKLYKDEIRDLRVLRHLPVDGQRAVEMMYIMLKCDAFKDSGHLLGVEFDENAYRMMLNMDEYMRKMEVFDAQVLADQPHVMQYLIETYFGGIPIHQNGAGFEDGPQGLWTGGPLTHEDLQGLGRYHKEVTRLPPLRRKSSAPPLPLVQKPSAVAALSVPRFPKAKQPMIPSSLPKAARLPPLPSFDARSEADGSDRAARRGSTSSAGSGKLSRFASAASFPLRKRKAVVEAMYVEGSELAEDEPVVAVGPLSLAAVRTASRTIAAFFQWCVAQLQYAEILRQHGPILEQHANACHGLSHLETRASTQEDRMHLLNAERQRLEAAIKELVAQHHLQHLQLAHLLHDQALAPAEEEQSRQELAVEESKAWEGLMEHWDRYWRELRLKTKQLMAEEEEYRAAILTQQQASRRKTTEQIHFKLRLVLEFANRRMCGEAIVTDRPQVPLPWY